MCHAKLLTKLIWGKLMDEASFLVEGRHASGCMQAVCKPWQKAIKLGNKAGKTRRKGGGNTKQMRRKGDKRFEGL